MIVTQAGGPSRQTPFSVSPGERNGKFNQNGKLGHSCTNNVIKAKCYDSRVSYHRVSKL